MVTYYNCFCFLISVDPPPPPPPFHHPHPSLKEVAAAILSVFMVYFLGIQLEVCRPALQQREQSQLNVCLSSAFQCNDLKPDPRQHPHLNLVQWALRPIISPREYLPPSLPPKPCSSLYLAGSPTVMPQSQAKVLFSQLTGGWCRTSPAWVCGVIPEVCRPTQGQVPPQLHLSLGGANNAWLPWSFQIVVCWPGPETIWSQSGPDTSTPSLALLVFVKPFLLLKSLCLPYRVMLCLMVCVCLCTPSNSTLT